jgi:hypothetical protein
MADFPAQQSPRTCIYCGAYATIVEGRRSAQWFDGILPSRMPLERHGPGETGGTEGGTASRPQRHSARPVCDRCDSGWMRQLQHAARAVLAPFILGHDATIAPEQQRVIAAWMTMTAMTAELARQGWGGADAEELAAFRDRQQPSDRWCVWIGRYIGPGPRWRQHGFCNAERPQANGAEHHSHGAAYGQLTTAAIGSLLLQSFSNPNPEFTQLRTGFAIYHAQRSGLIPVWPVLVDRIDSNELAFIGAARFDRLAVRILKDMDELRGGRLPSGPS